MALKDVLVPQPKMPAKNWIDEMRERLDDEDFEWLLACINNPQDYSGVYIANKMTSAGYPVSSTTINNLRIKLRG